MLVLLIGLLICRTVFLQPTVTWQDDAHGSKTAIQNKIFLLIGDSMMGGATGYFLSDSLKAEGARSVIIDFHTSSGLCRPDFFNWNDQLNTLLISHDFDIDMVWVAGHIGCKNTQALNGMLRELCRRESIPLLIINYDLSDPRIVSREGIIEQIDHFMENIMKAKKMAS